MYVQYWLAVFLLHAAWECSMLLSFHLLLQTELLDAVLSGDALHTDSILRSARVSVDERLKVSRYTWF